MEGTSDQLENRVSSELFFIDRFPFYSHIRQRFKIFSENITMLNCNIVYVLRPQDILKLTVLAPNSLLFPAFWCHHRYVLELVTTVLGTGNLSKFKVFESVDVESPMNSSLFNITANSTNEVSINHPYRNGLYPKEYIGCIKIINDDIGKFHQ